jgi:hypothetical protein
MERVDRYQFRFAGRVNMQLHRLVAFLVFTAMLVAAGLWGSDPIPPQKLQPLLALIKPEPGENAWEKIPWRTDLWQARQLAAEQGKPILLWEMDGHPLGCT